MASASKTSRHRGGYSHFFAGGYVSATGPSDDADFGYAQATINF